MSNEVDSLKEKIKLLETELSVFKNNNLDLVHRCNAAIASWDEERERALREATRVKQWREKYENLEKYIRFVGKQICVNTGGTFENDPIDAILDAAARAFIDRKPERVDELNSIVNSVIEEKKHMELSHEKTLESLKYSIERTKVFEALAETLYKAEYDNVDGIKKIYEAVREKYPVGTYYPPEKK